MNSCLAVAVSLLLGMLTSFLIIEVTGSVIAGAIVGPIVSFVVAFAVYKPQR